MDIDELQERYDELTNIIDTLDMLADSIEYYKDRKEDLDILRIDIQHELDEIEPQLRQAYDEEEKAQEREYWASQF